MLAPDWAEKSFVLFYPIGEQQVLRYFGVFLHRFYGMLVFWILLARLTFILIYFREPQKLGKSSRLLARKILHDSPAKFSFRQVKGIVKWLVYCKPESLTLEAPHDTKLN